MIVDIGKKFKTQFSDFNRDDFLPTKEKENHKKERPFFFEPLKDQSGMLRMVDNPKYINVRDSEINRRRVKWFSATDYCKKN